MSIPPGESRTFSKQVRVEQNGTVCFYASAPNHSLENDLNDNRTCVYASLGDEEWEWEHQVNVFPNPIDNILTISGRPTELEAVKILSTDGRKMPFTILSKDEGSVTLDLSPLNRGIYLLQMRIGDKVVTKKVIKE